MSKKEIIVLAIVGVLILAAIVGIAVAKKTNQQQTIVNDFVAPPFDAAAQTGQPTDVPENGAYGALALREDAVVRMCANVFTEGNAALVYLTSESENVGWIRIKLLDADGNVVGESGLLRPGEYVRAVQLNKAVSEGTMLTVKILVYEPETYVSIGSAGAQVRIAGPLK